MLATKPGIMVVYCNSVLFVQNIAEMGLFCRVDNICKCIFQS